MPTPPPPPERITVSKPALDKLYEEIKTAREITKHFKGKGNKCVVLNLTTTTPELTWPEMVRALDGHREHPAVIAIMQILDFQLSNARGHEGVPTATAEERCYGAGAAKLATDAITAIHLMSSKGSIHPSLAYLRNRFHTAKGDGGEDESDDSGT